MAYCGISEAMRRTEGETKRMGRLIDDLLTLARLDQRQHPPFEDVELVLLASDAVADARAIEPDRPIELVHGDAALVHGDADQLRQVFGNLLANARVHTPPSTPVRVEVAAEEDACRVIVSDKGPGIAPEQLERILKRPDSLLTLYRDLIALRQAEPALHSGSFEALEGMPDGVFAFIREHGDSRFVILLNFAPEDRTIASPVEGIAVCSTTPIDRQPIEPGASIVLARGEGLIVLVHR